MRRSEWEDRCKLHPEHGLSKGVCPYCLRERLTHLSASSSATNTTHASSSSTTSLNSTNSNPSSGVVAAPLSPPGAAGTTEGNCLRNTDRFLKSRSIAVDVDSEKEIVGQKHKDNKIKKKKKKIERFFSKIIHGPGKKSELGHHDLHQSRTMKEKSAPKWVPF